jgi:pseudaminic acid cytidylyltransferase
MRIAIIPARGGSKRIQRKNIRTFAGRPIIEWPITAAHDSGLFDKIIVSTDDEEIAEVGRRAGATVPFMRPQHLADDFTDTKAVIQHSIAELKLGGAPEVQVCCFYPTSAFVDAQMIKDGQNRLISEDVDFVLSITAINSIVYRSFTTTNSGKIRMLFPENYPKRTQDLPQLFCDAAQFYWARVRTWQSKSNMLGPNSVGVFMDSSRVQDIDTEEDWVIAEKIFLRQKGLS